MAASVARAGPRVFGSESSSPSVCFTTEGRRFLWVSLSVCPQDRVSLPGAVFWPGPEEVSRRRGGFWAGRPRGRRGHGTRARSPTRPAGLLLRSHRGGQALADLGSGVGADGERRDARLGGDPAACARPGRRAGAGTFRGFPGVRRRSPGLVDTLSQGLGDHGEEMQGTGDSLFIICFCSWEISEAEFGWSSPV